MGKRCRTVCDAEPLLIDLSLRCGVEQWVGPYAVALSRATAATVKDQEGRIRAVKSGELRFQGTRRVENKLAHTEDFSQAQWLKLGTGTPATVAPSAAVPPTGSQAWLVDLSGAGDDRLAQVLAGAIVGRYCLSVWARSVAGSGTFTLELHSGPAIVQMPLTTAWKRFRVLFDNPTAGNLNVYLGNRGVGGTLTQAILASPQCEYVGGQANQAPGEYVSVGQYGSHGAMAPYYHGVLVDGVKCFDTHCGNTVSGDEVIEAVGAPLDEASLLGAVSEPQSTNFETNSSPPTNTNLTTSASEEDPNGAFTGNRMTESGGLGAHFCYQGSLGAPVIGQAYTLSCFIKRVSANKVQLTPSANWAATTTYANFDLVAKTLVGQGAGVINAGIEDVGNGWVRVWLSTLATTTSSGAGVITATIAADSDIRLPNKNNDGWSFIRAFAMIEPLRGPTTFINTAAATVTRLNDVLTVVTPPGVELTRRFSVACDATVFTYDTTVFYNLFVSQIDTGNKIALYRFGPDLISEKRIATTAYTSVRSFNPAPMTPFKVAMVADSVRGHFNCAGGAGSPFRTGLVHTPYPWGPVINIGPSLYGAIRRFRLFANAVSVSRARELTQ